MLIIYPKGGGEVVAVWSGVLNTLETIYPDNPDMLTVFDQIMIEQDDPAVINRHMEYAVKNGQLYRKPLANISLSKNSITSDGQDETTLTVTLTELPELDVISTDPDTDEETVTKEQKTYSSVDVYFNELQQALDVVDGVATIYIDATEPGTVYITMSSDFRYNTVSLEVT